MITGSGRMHGGDIYSYNEGITDLSVNINPLGVLPEIMEAAREGLHNISKYPDQEYRKLRRAIAEKNRVSSEDVVCGNGASEIIFNTVQALRPGRVLLICPSFTEYEAAAGSVGAEKICYFLKEEEDFRIGADIAGKIVPGIDLVMICNPNNPTGKLADPVIMKSVADRCRETGTFLLIDESFIDFTDNGEGNSFIPFIHEYGNIIVIRSFTKMYCCPGIRLGYGITGDHGLIRRIALLRQPWSVSCAAESVGIMCCREKGLEERTRKLVHEEKERIYAVFDRLRDKGIHFLRSDANFILFHASGDKGGGLYDSLMERNILIRSCDDFTGLYKGWYRTAAGSREMNDRFFRALTEIYG